LAAKDKVITEQAIQINQFIERYEIAKQQTSVRYINNNRDYISSKICTEKTALEFLSFMLDYYGFYRIMIYEKTSVVNWCFFEGGS